LNVIVMDNGSHIDDGEGFDVNEGIITVINEISGRIIQQSFDGSQRRRESEDHRRDEENRTTKGERG